MACEQGEMDQAELATQLWFDGPRRQPAQTDQDLAQVKSMMMPDVLTGNNLDFAISPVPYNRLSAGCMK
ncbi:MAG: hypothetical protein R2932_30800 [Caldilineaceae bacterium]